MTSTLSIPMSPTSEVTRSAVVNATTAGAQVVVFAGIALLLGGPALIAARWLLAALTGVARFFLNRHWAFGARQERKRSQGLRFAAMTGVSITLGTIAFGVLLALFPGDPGPLAASVLQLISMSVVWLTFTCPATVRWVFRAGQDAVDDADVDARHGARK